MTGFPKMSSFGSMMKKAFAGFALAVALIFGASFAAAGADQGIYIGGNVAVDSLRLEEVLSSKEVKRSDARYGVHLGYAYTLLKTVYSAVEVNYDVAGTKGSFEDFRDTTGDSYGGVLKLGLDLGDMDVYGIGGYGFTNAVEGTMKGFRYGGGVKYHLWDGPVYVGTEYVIQKYGEGHTSKSVAARLGVSF